MVIRIPESRKFLLVESGTLGIGIQNPAEIHLLKMHIIRINGFHAHPYNHGHAADYADRADHIERTLYAGEF